MRLKGPKMSRRSSKQPKLCNAEKLWQKGEFDPFFFSENDFLYVLLTWRLQKFLAVFKLAIDFFPHINFRSARSARRKPVLKGDSTESSNPFYVSDDEDTYNEDSEKFDQSFKGESLRNHAKAKEDVVLPEWLVELPEDLEVGHYVLGQLDLFSPSLIRP